MPKTTVVVVDDSALIRALLTEIINAQTDMEVVGTAADPYQAREIIRSLNPDVITLDVEMPRMDGFEVAKNIRTSSRLKDLPIIMITSRTGEKHRERAFSLGVNKYLGKPYQEDLLLSNIQELLHIRAK